MSKSETDAQDRGNFVNAEFVNVHLGNCKNVEKVFVAVLKLELSSSNLF